MQHERRMRKEWIKETTNTRGIVAMLSPVGGKECCDNLDWVDSVNIPRKAQQSVFDKVLTIGIPCRLRFVE